jgi:serine/threonine-protein kinase
MAEQTEQLRTALAGRYAIERELGAGGMATVYMARDVKHNRPVALKVLRPELAAVIGAQRFLKEIEVTANLQHPHILPLHDSGEADSFLYYVMPYVEGETLREKLDREKQFSIDEAVGLTRSVAAALDYAHRHDVIHRDIKPENILLHDGQAQVADFGIALAVSHAGGERLTETGLSIGTPHYMSPEQAMGDRELDARSDVYSLGAMLYEMLVGDPPYTGSTAQAIVAKVITEKAPLVTAARPSAPAHVAAAIDKALQKLPADRFSSAAVFADALVRPGAIESPGPSGERAAAPAPGVRLRSANLPWALLAIAAVVIGGLAVALLQRSPAQPAGVVRAVLELPSNSQLADVGITLAPDGSRLIVSAVQNDTLRLLQRRLDQLEFTPIAGSRGGGYHFLSPDGAWVGFLSPDGMMKAPTDGGPAVQLDDDALRAGGDWTDDGIIVYSPSYRSGLWRIAEDGGAPEMLSEPDSARDELAHWWPQVLPGGRHVLFTAMRTPVDRASLEVLDLETGERKVVLEGGVSGRYVPTGHLLYARSEVLFAVPFDLGSLEVSGSAVPVVEDLAMDKPNGLGGFAVSDNGTLAYVAASEYNAEVELLWLDRQGNSEPAIATRGRYRMPAVSPDKRWIALTVEEPGENRDVWVFDLERGTRSRLTSGGAADFHPVWTPSGDRVIYVSEQPVFDLYWRPADGSGPAAPLLVTPFDKFPWSFTPDGSALLLVHSVLPRAQLWIAPLDGTGQAEVLLESELGELGTPALSPDGRWLVYVSDESGRDEIYLVPYPDVTGRRRQVSVDGAGEPRWTRGGRELVFQARGSDRFMAVSIDPATGEPGQPMTLFRDFTLVGSYDVTPDGERFLMLRRQPSAVPRQVVVVTNWFEELKRKLAE